MNKIVTFNVKNNHDNKEELVYYHRNLKKKKIERERENLISTKCKTKSKK